MIERIYSTMRLGKLKGRPTDRLVMRQRRDTGAANLTPNKVNNGKLYFESGKLSESIREITMHLASMGTSSLYYMFSPGVDSTDWRRTFKQLANVNKNWSQRAYTTTLIVIFGRTLLYQHC
jgi:hypothetical protein